jgi:hypothetical protein
MGGDGIFQRSAIQRANNVPARLLVLVILTMAGLSGCGYRFSGDRDPVVDIQRVCIPPMTNTTTKVGIETMFTNNFIFEVNRNGYAAVVERDQAQAVLTGVIRDLRTGSIARRNISTTLERRVTVTVDLWLKDKQGKVLWQSSLTDREAYTVLADKTSTEGNLRRALDVISQRLAEKFHYRYTASF